MKILWLTRSRRHRALAHFFEDFQKAICDIADVTVVEKAWEDRKPWHKGVETDDSKRADEYYAQQKHFIMDPNEANKFDVIYSDSPAGYDEVDWASIHAPKAIRMSDQHGSNVNKYFTTAFNKYKFSIFFVTYRDPTKKFHEYMYQRHVCWLPPSISPSTFDDYKLHKDIKVLFTGRTDKNIYPLRHLLTETLEGKPYYKRIQRFRDTVNPDPNRIVGKKYAQMLNRSVMSVTGTSKHNYAVVKIFEIPACNSVLGCDMIPEMRDLGFIPDVNMFRLKRKWEEKIPNKIKEFLNSGKVEDVSKAGYELIHTLHTNEVRAKEFIKYLENII